MRQAWDWYPTPSWATSRLLDSAPSMRGARVLEPCVGAGDISDALIGAGCCVETNDFDRRVVADSHLDATFVRSWQEIERPDFVVTNPPFSLAPAIVPLAWEHATVGVAMLLRLSYLEPCENRATWLEAHPPGKVLVLPRISFTGDGKTDSVTCAWIGWAKQPGVFVGPAIEIAAPPRAPEGPMLGLMEEVA